MDKHQESTLNGKNHSRQHTSSEQRAASKLHNCSNSSQDLNLNRKRGQSWPGSVLGSAQLSSALGKTNRFNLPARHKQVAKYNKGVRAEIFYARFIRFSGRIEGAATCSGKCLALFRGSFHSFVHLMTMILVRLSLLVCRQ